MAILASLNGLEIVGEIENRSLVLKSGIKALLESFKANNEGDKHVFSVRTVVSFKYFMHIWSHSVSGHAGL